MFTQEELKAVLQHWQLDLPLADIQDLDRTKTSSHVWQVGPDYILKAGAKAELLRNLAVAQALQNQGFSAAVPLAGQDGRIFFEDRLFFSLSPRLKGQPLAAPARLDTSMASKYGLALGRLHLALQEAQLAKLPDENALDKSIRQALASQAPSFWGLTGNLKNSLLAQLDQLPRQLIHRDPNPGNILFNNHEVSGFIDFDLSQVYTRLWDPCYLATAIFSEADDGAYSVWPDLLASILAGYAKVNSFSRAEKEAVFSVVLSIQLVCLAYFTSQPDQQELARKNSQIMQYILAEEAAIKRVVQI